MYLVVCLLIRTRLLPGGLVGGVANSSCRNGGRGRSPRMFAVSGTRRCGLDFRFRRGGLGRPRAGDGEIREPPLVKCQTRRKYTDHIARVALRARERAKLWSHFHLYKGYERLQTEHTVKKSSVGRGVRPGLLFTTCKPSSVGSGA